MENEEPQQETSIKKDSKQKTVDYLGVWAKDKGGNTPILCIHPDFLEQSKEFLKQLEGQVITASIRIEEKPLITRLNIRGIKGFALDLLGKVLQG